MEPEKREDRAIAAKFIDNAVKAEVAASKFLDYISKHTSKFRPPFKTNAELEELDDYYEKNWDKIVKISCKNNALTPEELISAVIDLL